MRRPNWKTVSTLVTTIAIAGCMDTTMALPGESPVAAISIAHAPAGMIIPDMSAAADTRASSSRSDSDGSDFTDEYTYSPNSGGFWFIGNVAAVYFPANSICDPNSSYGSDQWDVPCVAAKSSIKVKATVHVAKSGVVWVDFDKHLRFVPTKDPSRYVSITMASSGAASARDISKLNIYYTPSIGGHGVNESASDASMVTYVNAPFGLLVRRIKHFSGYLSVGRGAPCTPSGPDDTDCVWVDDGGGAIGGQQ